LQRHEDIAPRPTDNYDELNNFNWINGSRMRTQGVVQRGSQAWFSYTLSSSGDRGEIVYHKCSQPEPPPN
jgi:hypothetical protein